MASASWLSLIEESCNPQEDLDDALAAFQAEPTGQAPAQAAALKLVRARLSVVSSIRHAAKPGHQKRIEDEYKQAKSLAQEQLEECKVLGDSWGEAAMLLALAEVHVEKRSTEDFKLRDFEVAMENAKAAQVAFQDVRDPNMEAQAWVVVADIHRRREVSNGYFRCGCAQGYSRCCCSQTFEALDRAKSLFEEAGNLAGVARVRHTLGVALTLRNEPDEGLGRLQEAYQDFVNLGNKLYQAIELLTMAQLHLRRRKRESGQVALQMSEEALEIFRVHASSCGTRIIEAREAVVHAHARLDDVKRSMQVALAWVEASEDDPRQHCRALVSLAYAWVFDGNLLEGQQHMEKALAVAQETGNEALEFEYLLKSSELHTYNMQVDRGLQLAMDALNIAQRSGERRKEAMAIHILKGVHYYNVLRTDPLDQEEAETYRHRAKEEQAIWQELEDEGRAAFVMLNFALMLGTESEFSRGRDIAEECEATFREVQDRFGEALALQMQTEFYSDLAECNCDPALWDVAVKKADQMRKCGDLLKDDQVSVKAWRALSRIQFRRDRPRYADAIRFAETAMSKADRMHDDEAVVECLIMVANYCTAYATHIESPARRVKAQGLRRKALGQSKTALNGAKMLWNKRLVGKALLCLGRVRLALASSEDRCRNLDKARQCLIDAIDTLQKQLGSIDQEALATASVAQVLEQLGLPDQALDAAEAACRLAQQSADLSATLALAEASAVMERVGRQQPQMEEFVKSEGDRYAEPPYPRPWRQPPPGDTHDEVKSPGKIKSLDPFEIKDLVMEMVRSTVGSSGEGPSSADAVLHMDTPLAEAGMDSLTALSFRNGLQRHLELKLPATFLDDYPTTRALANRLFAQSLAEP